MKKIYSKPYLAVESFQLDAAIATSCSSNKKLGLNYSMDICTAEEESPGLNYFGKACIHNVEDVGDDNDYICYHGPTVLATDIAMNS